MTYLLDTAVFLWMVLDQRDKLSKKAAVLLEDTSNELILSVASVWEIAIKYSLGKLELKQTPEKWLPQLLTEMGLSTLPISQAHALKILSLPEHHRDPFDRILLAQANCENMPLVSPDKLLKKYRVELIW